MWACAYKIAADTYSANMMPYTIPEPAYKKVHPLFRDLIQGTLQVNIAKVIP